MKISYNWLQKHIEEKLPNVDALKETIIFHAFEVEDTEKVGDDTVMDIKVLPDRAHDCLSHFGIAREIAGLLGLTLKSYVYPALPDKTLSTKIEIQSDICRRYMAIELNGVTVGPSPKWLKESLETFGMKSINNIVDATNYVLLDRGQPVHAYDADKIDGGIVVRPAHEAEQITTLSQENKILSGSDLIIADYLGPLAIAGIKGGTSAEITENTKRIIIEVANFEPKNIRKTAKRLGLATDASKRFENELTPEIARSATEHVVSLIQEIAGGEVVGIFDDYKNPPVSKSISFSLSDISRLLGPSITEQDIELLLSRYQFSYTKDANKYVLTVPAERFDLSGPADIAEEIGKLIGYDKIPVSDLPVMTKNTELSEYKTISSVKLWLATNGFREVMNYSFTKKGDVYIAYGAKDKSALRTNLSEALKESYEKNKLNANLLGLESVKLFEIGNVFIGQTEELRVATVDKGSFEELPLIEFIKKYNVDISKSFDKINVSGKFKMWSLYPYITRDIALWVSKSEGLPAMTAHADQAGQKKLEEIVANFAKDYCVREPVLFDRFEKPARPHDGSGAGGDVRVSVAYRLVFQSFEKTLTEADVEKWFSELVKKIKESAGFEIR